MSDRPDAQAGFLYGHGEMAARVLAFDWAGTPMGPVQSWSVGVKAVVGMLLRSPVPIVSLWGDAGTMIYNDAYSVFAGGRHPRLLGSAVREGWPEVADFNDNVMKTVLAGGTLAYRDQELTLHRHGRPEQVSMNLDYSPVLDEAGKPIGVIAIVVETTEKVAAQRRLAAERERLARLFDQSPAFMAMLSGPEHRFDLINPAYRKLIGRDVLGLTVAETVPESIEQGYLAMLDDVYVNGATIRADGQPLLVQPGKSAPMTTKYVDFAYQPLTDEAGGTVGVFVLGVDVTEKILAERQRDALLNEANETLERMVEERTAALARSEKTIRTIFENSYLLQGLLTPDGDIVFANTTSLAAIELTLDDVVGQPFWDSPWFRDTAGMPEKVRAGIDRARSGHAISMTMQLDLPTGQRQYEFSMRPALDEAGQVVALVPEAVDVTARVRTEEALRHSVKMEAIGNLTGGVAHDFNNLLTAILGSLELLRKRLPADPNLHRYIETAMQGTLRGKTLTSRMLAFARRQELSSEPLDLARLVSGMLELIQRSLGPMIDVDIRTADPLPPVTADRYQLELALLNLAVNARDAMSGQGRLTIAAREERVGDDQPLAPGVYVVLSTTDTGDGMDATTLSHATEPFFTTKEVGKGTGLGLSMVQGLAEQSGGRLKIDSAPGRGTAVEIWLPASATDTRESEAPAEPAKTAADSAGGLSILAVDDDALILMNLEDMLRDMGHSVVGVGSARAAIEHLRDSAFDLMITDHAMPQMTGTQLIAETRHLAPDLPVILATGYSGLPVEPDVQKLPKPYSETELAAALANARSRL